MDIHICFQNGYTCLCWFRAFQIQHVTRVKQLKQIIHVWFWKCCFKSKQFEHVERRHMSIMSTILTFPKQLEPF